MRYQFDILRQSRKNLIALLAPFTLEQLNQIPSGFNNNLIWNFGHVIVSQQILCYKLSGLQPIVSEKIIEKYKKGSVPSDPVSQDELEELQSLAKESVDILERDYQQEIFKDYNEYQSHFGVVISSIEDAIIFSIAHEGLHMGYIMAMRKLIQ